MEKRMRGVKDEANWMSPLLLPRVHVTDNERGDPAALYRQLSFRSRSRDSDSSSTGLSYETSVAGKRERNLLISFRNADSPSKFADKQKSCSQSVGKFSVTADSLVGKVTKGSNHPADSDEKNEYRFKNFSSENLSSSDHLKVPAVRSSETDSRCRKDPRASTDLSLQLHTSGENTVEGAALLNNAAMRQVQKPETAHWHEQVKGVHNHEDVSQSSGMDSASGLSSSPDHVVKVILDKQSSKMRTAMIDQQRIFADQVFELHRLITVQKTLARSPNMLLGGGKGNMTKPGTAKKISHVQKMASKVKHNVKEIKPATESLKECMIPKFPLPLLSKELKAQQHHLTVRNRQPPSPWWFSAPGNHWLVPVVSPPEGFFYKPYAGPPRPPTSGCVVSMFGGDSFQTGLGFPVPHQFSHSHITRHTNPFGHISQGMPCCTRKLEAPGSTASSPPERHERDVLPLFPTEPACPKTETGEYKQLPVVHAIKAVPHNPTSASESAARILYTIQEERKH